jgi:hypothetical protein
MRKSAPQAQFVHGHSTSGRCFIINHFIAFSTAI